MINKTKYMNKYFEKKREDLSFITLKKGASINFKDKVYVTKQELPVPVRVEKLLQDIKKQEDYDGVTINNIIDGIICIQATDENFEYLDVYHEMLNALNFDLVPYIMLCINNFEDNQNDDGVIYGKALINIKRDEKTCFIYASVLEKRGSDAKAKNAESSNQFFLEEAHEFYEKCLDYDERFALSYYKLGYYYKLKQLYAKAELFWIKHQELDDDPLRIDEIRKELIDLKPFVDYENGFNLVLKEQPGEGLELLLPLVKIFNGWWNLLFFIGLAYRMLGEYKIAETYFENVLKIEENQKEALNELGLCKMCREKYTEAEELFTTLLNLEPGNCEVFCNRAVACLYNG
ncbi:MAG: repeat-containing protein, partial [Bacillota bacterium]|nr:repeat-containing protein [Bacillota bacterium]